MINCVTLVGNLTKDVELKEVNKKALAKFSIAVNKDKDTCYFFNCYAWEKLAETIDKYFKKGSKIAINGELIQQTYKDKEGKQATSIQVHVKNFEFVEKTTE